MALAGGKAHENTASAVASREDIRETGEPLRVGPWRRLGGYIGRDVTLADGRRTTELQHRVVAAQAIGRPLLWVAAPDRVCDAAETLRLFNEWEPQIRALGFPVAFIAQNGLTAEQIPWERLACLFIGGDDAFKLGIDAMLFAHEAKRRGKLVHVGRVNSGKRVSYCQRLGADSIDGTGCSAFPDTKIPLRLADISRASAFHNPDCAPRDVLAGGRRG